MNKIAIFLALALFVGCQVSAQLTPVQGGLLTLGALPFILNAGQFSSGQGVLPPPIVGPGVGGGAIGGGPIIIRRTYQTGGHGHGKGYY